MSVKAETLKSCCIRGDKISRSVRFNIQDTEQREFKLLTKAL